TGWWWLVEATIDDLEAKIDENFRIIDLEIDDPVGAGPGPTTYTAAFVANAGVHKEDEWWWYPDISAHELQDEVDRHKARILDLELFMRDGVQRFAAVLVPNDDATALDWSWYLNTDADFLAAAID